MATIIDLYPSATEADAAINSAVGKAIPPQLQFPKTSAPIDTDRSAGTVFSSGQPDMLFISEYYTGKGFSGVVVAWENYFGASHYSVYKRSKFTAAFQWRRILVIDSVTLKKETAQFLPYVNNKLKIPMTTDQGYCIMDADVTLDNVYEYKVVAGFLPASEKFHYDLVLSSRGLTRDLSFTGNDTIETLSQSTFGTLDYAWVISLLNEKLYFFNQSPGIQKILSSVPDGLIYAPIDVNDIARVFVESVYYFGLTKTVMSLLRSMNPPNSNSAFFQAVNDSFDEKSKTFSFRSLNTRLSAVYSAYGKILSSASQNVGTAGFTVFSYNDIVGFDSFGKLNTFMLELKTIFINVIFAGQLAGNK